MSKVKKVENLSKKQKFSMENHNLQILLKWPNILWDLIWPRFLITQDSNSIKKHYLGNIQNRVARYFCGID